MHDKQIHRDEFRLRILTTNMCRNNCRNCLNDFQPKTPEWLLNGNLVASIADDYYALNLHKYVITFSGGEPALHPNLEQMLNYFDLEDAILVSRESALLRRKDYQSILDAVGKLHISVGEKISERVLYMIRRFMGEVIFQKVVFEDTSYEELDTLCYEELYPIKFFQDFHSSSGFDAKFLELMSRLKERHPKVDIRYRFTGVQENRGLGCLGCKNRCITLKALWVFPNGLVSPCPQRKEFFTDPLLDREYMQKAYAFHRVK